jgi:hypothetical protein
VSGFDTTPNPSPPAPHAGTPSYGGADYPAPHVNRCSRVAWAGEGSRWSHRFGRVPKVLRWSCRCQSIGYEELAIGGLYCVRRGVRAPPPTRRHDRAARAADSLSPVHIPRPRRTLAASPSVHDRCPGRPHPSLMKPRQPLSIPAELFLSAWITTGSGKPRLHRKGTALMPAGALLAEPVLSHHLIVKGEELELPETVLAGIRPLPYPLETIAAYPEHKRVSIWLAYLSQHAVSHVADRLITAGLVAPPFRRWGRPYYRYTSDWSAAAWPPDRIRIWLRERRAGSHRDMALLALAQAGGLVDMLLRDDPGARDRADLYVTGLRGCPPEPLLSLADHVRGSRSTAVPTYGT